MINSYFKRHNGLSLAYAASTAVSIDQYITEKLHPSPPQSEWAFVWKHLGLFLVLCTLRLSLGIPIALYALPPMLIHRLTRMFSDRPNWTCPAPTTTVVAPGCETNFVIDSGLIGTYINEQRCMVWEEMKVALEESKGEIFVLAKMRYSPHGQRFHVVSRGKLQALAAENSTLTTTTKPTSTMSTTMTTPSAFLDLLPSGFLSSSCTWYRTGYAPHADLISGTIPANS